MSFSFPSLLFSSSLIVPQKLPFVYLNNNLSSYMKVVYYQRLRHMVKDKFQVRSIHIAHSVNRLVPLLPFLFPFSPLSSFFCFFDCQKGLDQSTGCTGNQSREGRWEEVYVSEKWSAIPSLLTAPPTYCLIVSWRTPICQR